ncbi:MAG: Ig-like domain-containing protein, partial [Myxococcota bacterium]
MRFNAILFGSLFVLALAACGSEDTAAGAGGDQNGNENAQGSNSNASNDNNSNSGNDNTNDAPAPGVNECELGTDNCSPLVNCIDTATGFECGACPSGTTGDGTTCTDVDGCADSPCFTGVTCTDVAAPGTGFNCGACPDDLSGDGIQCFGSGLASPVRSSSACLTLGTGATALVTAELVDDLGDPVTDATVTASTTAGMLGAVTPAGNVYGAVLTVPSTGATEAVVSLTFNGDALENTATVRFEAPIDSAVPGVGACPADGNVRVRVVDAASAPIENAYVMVGDEPEALSFEVELGAGPAQPNTGRTDAQGYIEFSDFGTALDGPVTVTAAGGAATSYVTAVSVNASEFVLQVQPLVDATTSGLVSGAITDFPAPEGDPIESGIVLGPLGYDDLATFDGAGFLFDSECYNAGGLAGELAVPGNLYFPDQCAFPGLNSCIQSLPEKGYTLELAEGSQNVVALGVG